MANAFKNAGVALSSTNATTLYRVPAGVNSSVVHSIYIANVDGTNSVNVNVEVSTDGAGSGSFFHVAKTVPVCLLYTSPSPRDATLYRMPYSA